MRTRVYGTNFDNRFTASAEIRESFYGRGGDDTFAIYHHASGADLSDRFFGGSGDDWLGTLVFDFTSGDRLTDYRQLSFDGGTGYDTVSATVTADVQGGETLNLGEIETSVLSVEHWDYDLFIGEKTGTGLFTVKTASLDDTLDVWQTSQISKLKINTRGGDDTVNYVAMEDVAGLQINMGGGDDYFDFSADWDASVELTLRTGKGADVVVINGSSTSHADGLTADIRTGSGNDTVVLEGMHSEQLSAGSGHDDIYILTGSFSNAADVVSTGSGRDRLFVELDAYSTVAIIEDFAAAKDVFVFDAAEAGELLPRDTAVTFDRREWQDSEEDRLFMDNAADRLYFGDNVLVEFSTDVTLTADNFTTGQWDFFA